MPFVQSAIANLRKEIDILTANLTHAEQARYTATASLAQAQVELATVTRERDAAVSNGTDAIRRKYYSDAGITPAYDYSACDYCEHAKDNDEQHCLDCMDSKVRSGFKLSVAPDGAESEEAE
jgi:hypothetical protein